MKKVILLAVMAMVFGNLVAQSNSYMNKNRAYIIAQDFVKSKLKYPKDADFYMDVVHESKSYGTCILLGKVDAKNAYGMTTRYVYKIWLSHNGKEWTDKYNWKFTKLIIEDSNTQQQSIFYK